MLVNEIISPQQLDEISLKQAVAIGALASSSLLNPVTDKESKPIQNSQPMSQVSQYSGIEAKEQLEVDMLVNSVIRKYRIKAEQAEEIVRLAKKYEQPVFPKAKDILAIIGIESSFNPRAISGLKTDPAIGLMQVRPKIWGLDPHELISNLELQIKMGSHVLTDYYKQLGSIDGAVHSFNIGIKNFKRKKGLNPKFVANYKNELKIYT